MARKVHGVGINDVGNTSACPFYKKWRDMLKRCYSHNWKSKNPSYDGCTVAEEWHKFSNFKEWMIGKNWQGMELDKDLIGDGNMLYSPDTCIFLPRELNRILSKGSKDNKGYHYHKRDGVYCAQVSINGKLKHLGSFRQEVDAKRAYIKGKCEALKSISERIEDQQIKDLLILKIERIRLSLKKTRLI